MSRVPALLLAGLLTLPVTDVWAKRPAADGPTTAPSDAAGTGKSAVPDKPLTYLTKSTIDFAALLPPPPAAGSPETQAELAELHLLQDRRTPEQQARCKDESKLNAFRAFAAAMGPNFTADRLPKTAKLLDAVAADAKFYTASAKNHWTRSRPPYVDPSLKPGALLEDEPSYPSSHSTRGIMFARILSEMVPEKADARMARGQEIGFDREIAAVHYPTDVAAGRVLGQAIAQALFASPQFQSDLAAAKAEVRGTLALAGQ